MAQARTDLAKKFITDADPDGIKNATAAIIAGGGEFIRQNIYITRPSHEVMDAIRFLAQAHDYGYQIDNREPAAVA